MVLPIRRLWFSVVAVYPPTGQEHFLAALVRIYQHFPAALARTYQRLPIVTRLMFARSDGVWQF